MYRAISNIYGEVRSVGEHGMIGQAVDMLVENRIGAVPVQGDMGTISVICVHSNTARFSNPLNYNK